MAEGRRSLGAVALSVAVMAAACVAPARTAQDYRADAASTAKDLASVLEGAALTLEVARAGSATGPYVSLRLTESEAAAESILSTFRSVQPPTEASDRLRSDLLEEMEAALAAIEEIRISVRRREFGELGGEVGRLRASAGRLRRLVDRP